MECCAHAYIWLILDFHINAVNLIQFMVGSRWSATTLLTFTVQCNACGKWRSVPSKEQYHDISDRKYERPWVCKEAQAWRENASCEDPSDISENEPSILWAVDETDIPKPPAGFARKVVVRGERSSTFADV